MKIQLLAAVPVGGELRFPSAGVIEADAEEGAALVDAGAAIEDDLDQRDAAELVAIATKLGLAFAPEIAAAELATLIRARWINRA